MNTVDLMEQHWKAWLDVGEKDSTTAVVEGVPGDGDYKPYGKWRAPDTTPVSGRFMVINGEKSSFRSDWSEQRPQAAASVGHGAKPLEVAQQRQREQQQRLMANGAENVTFRLEDDVPRLICAKQRAETACVEWEAKWYESQQRNGELCEQVVMLDEERKLAECQLEEERTQRTECEMRIQLLQEQLDHANKSCDHARAREAKICGQLKKTVVGLENQCKKQGYLPLRIQQTLTTACEEARAALESSR
jgi:uncharacterized protein YbaR (Trm112 family)